MANCEIVRVGAELHAAPPHEPLASCAFAWPEGWAARGFPWAPPPLFVPAPLLRLERDGGALDVYVARFGCEVDGLAFLETWHGGPLDRRGWNGIAVARGARDDVEWRVVHSGPALHLLAAQGEARAHVDAAALSLRSESGLGPEAEPVRPIDIGPLRCLRLSAWTPEPGRGLPHGHHRVHLRLLDPRSEAPMAYLRLHVVDRRVHVGFDPRALLAAADADERASGLTDFGAAAADPGAGGPAETRTARLDGVAVEVRRALRQIGAGLAVVTGVWPTAGHAPVAWLNGRRHFDVALATMRSRP